MNKKRTLVIGDIHAGLKGLQQVLKKAGVTKDDTLIFLGDYVDGWSEAVETVDFIIELSNQQKCICIRGNHDELCYDWLTKKKDNPLWLQHGGEATMNSYAKASKATITRHLEFYENLHNTFVDKDNRLFLHAGFTNLKGIAFEFTTKTFYWDRTLWELALSLDPLLKKEHIQYPKRLLNYNEMYIGHTPVTRIGKTTPQNYANVWNIDTGAAFRGPLTVMDIATKEFWQSKPIYTLYPNEMGRN